MGAAENLRAKDDGLACKEIGRWAETKYRLIALYDELFACGMKYKWDQRVYIDLYSGAGLGKLRGTGTVLKGSPIIALDVSCSFDKYIFCEDDPALLAALKKRVQGASPESNVTYVEGKCDDRADEILAAVPQPSTNNKVLCLCFVDPFDFGIKFETLRKLSTRFMDFLVLLAIGMDANRNYDLYVDGNSSKIDEALGNTAWRTRWKKVGTSRDKFRPFLAAEFSLSMQSLGYLPQSLDQMKLVRSDEKNLPLYYIALFSKHKTAYDFWGQVLKYSTDQQSLFG